MMDRGEAYSDNQEKEKLCWVFYCNQRGIKGRRVHIIMPHVREDGLAQFLAENTPFPWVADTTTIHLMMGWMSKLTLFRRSTL